MTNSRSFMIPSSSMLTGGPLKRVTRFQFISVLRIIQPHSGVAVKAREFLRVVLRRRGPLLAFRINLSDGPQAVGVPGSDSSVEATWTKSRLHVEVHQVHA